MSNAADDLIRIRAARLEDESLLVACAARLTAFDVPPWRPPTIATADAREMMDAVRAVSPDNDVLIAERSGVPVGCLHILGVDRFFRRAPRPHFVIATTEAAEGSGVGQPCSSMPRDGRGTGITRS